MIRVFTCFFALLAMSCEWKADVEPDLDSGEIPGLKLTYSSIDQGQNFNSIFFTSEYRGFVAGYNGALYRTIDGGNSWTPLVSGTSLTLFDIFFVNENEGYVVGGRGSCSGSGCTPPGPVMLRTLDGGDTWTKVSLPATQPGSYPIELHSVWFTTRTKGFAVGYGTILSTVDGKSWVETTFSDLGGIMLDVEFTGEQHGLIACAFGRLIRTVDGGLHWKVSIPLPETGSNNVSLVNPDLVFAATSGKTRKSNDFGITWTDVPASPDGVYEVVFASEDVGFAFGYGEWSGGDWGHSYGAIHYTTDGGQTWTGSSRITESGYVTSAHFPSTRKGYALSSGRLIKVELE